MSKRLDTFWSLCKGAFTRYLHWMTGTYIGWQVPTLDDRYQVRYSLKACHLFWKIYHTRTLFYLFSSFQTNITNFTQINVKICPSSIQCSDSNPQPSEHKSPPITTRPGLPPKLAIFVSWVQKDGQLQLNDTLFCSYRPKRCRSQAKYYNRTIERIQQCLSRCSTQCLFM